MNIKTKETIRIVIVAIVMFGITFSSFELGMYIKDRGANVLNFCETRNQSFRATMTDSDPSYPKHCLYPGSNSIDSINFTSCYENSSADELQYMQDCNWMGPAYLIMAGTLVFGYIIPAMFMFILGMSLNPLFMEEENGKNNI